MPAKNEQLLQSRNSYIGTLKKTSLKNQIKISPLPHTPPPPLHTVTMLSLFLAFLGEQPTLSGGGDGKFKITLPLDHQYNNVRNMIALAEIIP